MSHERQGWLDSFDIVRIIPNRPRIWYRVRPFLQEGENTLDEGELRGFKRL